MTELANISRILSEIGFALEAEQPHISGERFLMAKDKLVLVARRNSDNLRVAIKISDKEAGQKDIRDEKRARDLLQSVSFADKSIIFPEEVHYSERDGCVVWAIKFIDQEKVFVEYPIEEQFFIALRAFEEQEAFHATTYEHLEKVKKVFPILYRQEYLDTYESFKEAPRDGWDFLNHHKKIIDKYANYLTHTDFVPHNFRVNNHKIYMLDCAPEVRTVHFGNKYEGWARFLNYMVIHNPKLEKLLSDYVRQNRGEEEYLSLRLMRVYKLGFLLDFYAKSLEKTEGDLRQLTLERIGFWHEVLKFVLADKVIPDGFVEEYKKKRDSLRSEEEKKRQREFAVA